jgi:hypothetical protein
MVGNGLYSQDSMFLENPLAEGSGHVLVARDIIPLPTLQGVNNRKFSQKLRIYRKKRKDHKKSGRKE